MSTAEDTVRRVPLGAATPSSASKRHLHFFALLILSAAVFAPTILAVTNLSLSDDRYSHALLMPVIAAGIAYLESGRILQSAQYNTKIAAVILLPAIVLRLAASGLTSQAVALVLCWIGVFVFCYGLPALRAAAFPAFLLLLTIPPPPAFMNQLSVTLQAASAELSHVLFRLLGMPVFRQGNAFSLPGIVIEVAEQCSGIRSTLALVISGILVSYFALRSARSRFILVLATAFVAILKNAIRIVFLSAMAVYTDESILHGILHHTYGGTVFSLVALGLIVPVLLALRKSELRRSLT